MPYGVGALFFAECDSTNTLAAEFARKGYKGPLWLTAGQQTAGRGRRGRVWASGGGNLYTSLLFRPSLKPSDLAALPYIVALAARETFITLGADRAVVRCKWPNDVLIDGKKACGVLIESSARNADLLDYVIIGIGMNLCEFPGDAAYGATSLLHATGKRITPREALSVLASHMFERLNDWDISSFEQVASEWQECSWGLGEKREIRTATDTFTGTPLSLSSDGGLIVRLDDGTEKRLYAGDVFPVSRPE